MSRHRAFNEQPFCNMLLSTTTVQIFLLLLAILPSQAQVYQREDNDGVVSLYTNQPPAKGNDSVELPPIYRENIEEKINQLKQSTPKHCDRHGGVNCLAGKDSDGSVVCADGFKDSVIPFSPTCTQTKLKVEWLVKFSESEDPIPFRKVFKANQRSDSRLPLKFILAVRNLGSIEAQHVFGTFWCEGLFEKSSVTGPESIPAYESAEYELYLPVIAESQLFRLADTRFEINCDNCSTIRRSTR